MGSRGKPYTTGQMGNWTVKLACTAIFEKASVCGRYGSMKCKILITVGVVAEKGR